MRTHRMHLLFLLCTLLLATHAEGSSASNLYVAVARDFSEEGYSVWAGGEGDLNADGIKDAAFILQGGDMSGLRREIFAVYFGDANGTYTLASRSHSDLFCNARNSYNVDIIDGSVLVELVHSVGEPVTSTILEFQYAKNSGDFRLIGEEYQEIYNQTGHGARNSVNYLTGKALYARHNSLGRKAVERRREYPVVYLREFDCPNWSGFSQSVYIDASLSVKEQ